MAIKPASSEPVINVVDPAVNPTADPVPIIDISPDPQHLRGVVLVMLAGCFWSLGGLLVRSIDSASDWQILWLRSSTVALMFFTILLLRHRTRVVWALLRVGWPGLIGGLSLAFGFSGFILAITNTTVANAVFILSAAPFPTALLAWLILRERVKRSTWLAMLLALFGVAVMVADGIHSGTWYGSSMALVAMLGFSGFAVALRAGRNRDMLPTFCIAGLCSALFAAYMSENLQVSLHDTALCIAMGTVQIGAGMYCFTLGSRHVSAVELALLSLTEVILAPIWVWLSIGETPGLLTLSGGVIVLLAIVLSSLAGIRRA
jgi:drug/metabolite transporter (DMT)-like permease